MKKPENHDDFQAFPFGALLLGQRIAPILKLPYYIIKNEIALYFQANQKFQFHSKPCE